MPQPLAVCENGHFFRSGIGFDPGETGVTATLTVQDAPRVCPICGTEARVLGGVYNIVGDTIELLRGPERTVTELERLRQILHEARESGASPEEVGGTLQREFPGWGRALAKLLVPRTPADFYALIAVLLVALEMLLGDKQAGPTVNIETDQVINNIVHEAPPVPGQHTVAPSPDPVSPTSTRSDQGEKVGRNKPCPCDSGLKFKKCHGNNGETRYFGS